MPTPHESESAALAFFHHYLELLFAQRNLAGIADMLHEQMTGFGTGAGEVAINRQQSITLYQQDMASAPNPIHFHIQQQQLLCLAPEQAYQFSAILRLETEILQQQLVFNQLRITLVAIKQHGQWQLTHLHASFPTDAHCEDESYPIKELEERNAWLEKGIKEKTHALENALAEIKQVAETDKLTGLHNRHNTDKLLQSCIEQAQQLQQHFSIILIDADHFKRVNDQFGHLAGDKLLIRLSQHLQTLLRKDDSIGRWGGEEFLIICPQVDVFEATKLAERICQTIAQTEFDAIGQQTLSLGVTQYQIGDDFDRLIARADQALYQAKHQGRNRVITA